MTDHWRDGGRTVRCASGCFESLQSTEHPGLPKVCVLESLKTQYPGTVPRVFAASILIPGLLFAQQAPASYSKALQLFAKQDFPGASAALEQTLHENPHYIPGMLLKARLSVVNGQMDQAHATLDRVLEEQPDTREAHFLLGFLYYLENDFDRAETALGASDQNDARVLLYRAMSAEGMNQREAAHHFYQRAIDADPAHSDARIAYARLLRKEGDNVQAAKLIDEALALSPTGRDVLYEKGLSLLEGGEYKEAVSFGERALSALGSVPSEREIRYLLMRAWQKAGNPDMAAKERALFERLPMPLAR